MLSGTLDVFLNNQWNRLDVGESISIPRGSVHGFRNSTGDVVRALNVHSPGLRFQEYLETMERLIREGKITGTSGLRNGIYLCLHTRTYRREVVSVRPPDRFIRVMAGIGRILGYKL